MAVDPAAMAIVEALPEKVYAAAAKTAFIDRVERDDFILRALGGDQDRKSRLFGQVRSEPVIYGLLIPVWFAVTKSTAAGPAANPTPPRPSRRYSGKAASHRSPKPS